tara:strand:+ start:713 stop:1258 length:546 start_codon:yes stop_codon:yes gene_type:complete
MTEQKEENSKYSEYYWDKERNLPPKDYVRTTTLDELPEEKSHIKNPFKDEDKDEIKDIVEEMESVVENMGKDEESISSKEINKDKYIKDLERYVVDLEKYIQINQSSFRNSGIPDYYIGKIYGYEARKIIEDYNLNFNIGNAVTYLLRAENKHKSPQECIEKAINHLDFELQRLENIKNKK